MAAALAEPGPNTKNGSSRGVLGRERRRDPFEASGADSAVRRSGVGSSRRSSGGAAREELGLLAPERGLWRVAV